MKANTITCKDCGAEIDITEALQHQMADELQKQSVAQNETLRKQYEAEAASKVDEAVKSALEKQNQQSESEKAKLQAQLELVQKRANDEAELAIQKAQNKAETECSKLEALLELEREKAKNAAELAADKERQKQEIEMQSLRSKIEAGDESNKKYQEELKTLLEKLNTAEKERADAEIKALEKLRDREKQIREEAVNKANEDNNTIIREKEETINRLREQLTTAKQVAEQGSQQLQGEILELNMEQDLRAAFPFDNIDEVKKGERGADIRQIVNERIYSDCGLILWECKNAKTYQTSWLGKLKDELAEEKAQIGVIVFSPTGGGGEDFKQLADNIWLVKPRYAIMLAGLLREICVRVAIANRNAEGKDIKIEQMYNYLTGGEFKNHIRYIIESYDEMAKQLDTEKKQAQKRWAAQEKILQKVTNNLYGMSGDLQGIIGKEIIALPEFEEELV
jgi:hypothetical protein